MPYQSRIPVAPGYLSALGQAVYNFAYAEWVIVYLTNSLQNGYVDGFGGKSIEDLANDFSRLSVTCPDLIVREKLEALAQRFSEATAKQNTLTRSAPITFTDGAQVLSSPDAHPNKGWTEETLLQAAEEFEGIAIEGNALYDGPFGGKH